MNINHINSKAIVNKQWDFKQQYHAISQPYEIKDHQDPDQQHPGRILIQNPRDAPEGMEDKEDAEEYICAAGGIHTKSKMIIINMSII